MGGHTSAPPPPTPTLHKKLGAWLARAINTVYQAETDGFVISRDLEHGGTVNPLLVKTDGDDSPVTVRGESFDTDGSTKETVTIPVRKDDFWKVEFDHPADVWWIPLIGPA